MNRSRSSALMNYEKSHLWQTAKSFTFSQKIIDFELEAH